MKKTSVIVVILLIAVVIVGAIGLTPLALFNTAVDTITENMFADNCTYQISYNNLMNNTSLSENIKAEVDNMHNVTIDVISVALNGMFFVAAVLIGIIAAILIIVGIYFIKNENCKNYVGTAFIAAACILLAFVVILAVCML